ncbi:MAG TPA: response regulator [Pyrinomonadaceae bacterium]|nr:response regulator [Pyrinomonadaceae bacterium]
MIESNFVPTSFPDYWSLMQLSSQFLSSGGDQSTSNSPDRQSSTRKSSNNRWALIVDDVADVTDMLAVLLTHAGFEVSTASRAQEAIALAREHHFDVIISDIGMPEMNGYQLAQALRSLPGYESVPMVAVTGYSMFDDRNRSLTAGFNEHVTKPLDPRAFLELIEQL